MTVPSRDRSAPISISVCAVMLTLVAVRIVPMKIASQNSGIPNATATPAPAASGSTTPPAAAQNATWPTRRSSPRSVSRPAMNISRMTPISERSRTTGSRVAPPVPPNTGQPSRLSAVGPSTRPTRSSPNTAGWPSRLLAAPASFADAIMTPIRRRSCSRWDMVVLAHVTGNRPVVDDRVNGVERVRVSPTDPEPGALARAAGILLRGGLVVFPTDTLYGLAADPRHAGGVARVYHAKGRMAARALPLIAGDLAQVEALATTLPAATRRLAGRFWPGPLTLVVDAAPTIVPGVHGGTGGVAVRVPDQAVARALALQLGFPVVATSANRSGSPASRLAEMAAAALEGDVDLVLDSGPTPGGEPSTIVDARGETPTLIRAGAIPFSLVLEAL